MSKANEQFAKLFALKASGKSRSAELLEELYSVADEQARAIHMNYIAEQRGLGFAAPLESTEEHPIAEELIDPEMVDFDALPSHIQDLRFAATNTARKLYSSAHKSTTAMLEMLLLTVAEHVHLEWARGMIADGWVYGPEEDEEKKTSPFLTNFKFILNDSELNKHIDYFVEIARVLLFNMLVDVACIPE